MVQVERYGLVRCQVEVHDPQVGDAAIPASSVASGSDRPSSSGAPSMALQERVVWRRVDAEDGTTAADVLIAIVAATAG